MKKLKLLGLLFAGIMMSGASAQAAPVLDVAGAAPVTTIGAVTDTTFDLASETGLDTSSNIFVFNSASTSPFGLSLSEAANLTFTYLGAEAGFINTFTTGAGVFSSDGSNIVGDSFSADTIAGLIDFVFGSSDGGSAANDGTITSPVQFAIALLSDTSAIILLDDGGAGTDFDDIAIRVDVSQVPLPPAVWLLISAVLGLVSFTRIRRSEARAA